MTELFLNFVNMSISAGWIVLAVIILRLLLKKAPKWITVLLWGIVAFRLICPFSIESALSLIPSTQTINPEFALNPVEIDSGVPIIDSVINPIISDATVTVQPEKDVNFFHIIMPYLAGLWLVGIFALLIYTVLSYIRLKKKIGTAVLYKDNIFQSESVVSPFVLGIIKPKIYLPFNMNESDMEHVIAHEKAHIKRKDHLWKPLGFLLLAIYWFNPLIWVGYILLCKDIELACDEKVVKELDTEHRADYSQALLSCSVNRRMIAACPLAFGEVGVKGRIKTILNYKKPAFWIIIVAIIASIVAAVCFLTNPEQNTLSKIKIPEAPNLFDNVNEIQVTIPEMYFDKYYVNDYHFILDFFQDIEVSKKEISKSRSEDRAKEYNVILRYGDSYLIIHFDKECKEFWINNGVKPSFSYQVIDNETVKSFFEKLRNQSNSDKITWTYRPMTSFTANYAKAFSFDFDYTHVEATCTNGEMWNLEVEGQPRDTTMRFEKGKNVYWTPSEAVIEKLPKKSEVSLTIFNNETQLHKCTIIFECVPRDLGTADFEIYFKESDGLSMVQSGDGILLFESSSISNVGGVDEPSNITTESLEKPPTMVVSCGNTSVNAWLGTYSWVYKNTKDGTAKAINADSSHPLYRRNEVATLPMLPTTISSIEPYRASMQFAVTPDKIEVKCYKVNEKDTDTYETISTQDMTFKLKEGEYLYEVIAEWNDSEECSGKAFYAFQTTMPDLEIVDVNSIETNIFAGTIRDTYLYSDSKLTKIALGIPKGTKVYVLETDTPNGSSKVVYGEYMGWTPSTNLQLGKVSNETVEFTSAIASVLNEKYRADKPDGLIHIENYHILANETASGTPLVSNSGHMQEATVYLLVYHMKYSVNGGQLEEVEGDFVPTAITFKIDENGHYTLDEYWTPRTGADFEKDVKNKFPGASAENVLNTEKYAEDLIKENWRLAREKLN